MKKNHLLLILAVTGTLYASCKRTLEAEPMDELTKDLVFDTIDVNADNAKAFLYGTYGLLPSYGNRLGTALLAAATDDAMASNDGDRSGDFRRGWISAFNVQDNAWNTNYKGIRMANIFLSNIDRVPTTDELKKEWKAEARFLRAFFYFELMKRWGGVPLVGDAVFDFKDNISLPRNTLEETKSYIVSELDAIKDELLPASLNNADLGRANKGAALALKARVLLYWASPLYNPSGNTQRWADAANAARDVVALDIYSLPSDFLSVFITGKTNEMIFAKMLSPNQSVEQSNGPIGYLNAAAGKGLTSPSQNLVDAFLTAEGKMITDAASGYDPANPYGNRDPRLDATVLYNGKKWLNRPVETFEGGLDKPGGILTQTKTGYYLRKLMGKFESNSAYANVTRHWVLFRYAEVLLSIAEAVNEESGPVQEVYDNLILVRERAGIIAGDDGLYGLPPLADVSKEALRAIIQNERRIEMAFEEQRFWDIRRWKIAEDVMNQPLRGMRIEKQQDGSFTYTPFTASTSTFDAAKMYWYPVPFNEMQTNSRMVQNPGWE